jgi:hypothetical protein
MPKFERERVRKVRSMTLVFEQKLFELLPSATEDMRLEASGIDVVGNDLVVVLDNLSRIARIPFRREPFSVKAGAFVGDDSTGEGYEDLSFDAERGRLMLLREAIEQESGEFEAEVVEWNDRFQFVRRRTLPFAFPDQNKGFEGLAWIRRDGRDWLMALCEGNRCRGGSKGKEPGGGRIHVFGEEDGDWVLERELRLPEDVLFEDYSGLAIDGDRVGVVSQSTSMLWVSHITPDGWDWQGPQRLYEFPRDDDGDTLYSQVEGLTWLGPERIAVVSDRRKKNPTARTVSKDQSIHVFDLD